MDNDVTFDWYESLVHTYNTTSDQIVTYAPKVLGALLLLALGWLLAVGLRALTRKLLRRMDWIFMRVAPTDGVKQEKLKQTSATLVGKVVYWSIIIFFLAAATNMLGWNLFAGLMVSIVNYLPNLILGLVIILAGVLLGNGARTTILKTAESIGIEKSELLVRSVQLLILLTAIIIGAEQMGIDVHLLSDILVISTGVFLAGGALAFGLGAKTLMANIIGAQYVRKHCRLGDFMTIGTTSGVVLEVTQTSIVLETDGGRLVVPAKEFHEQTSRFGQQSDSGTSGTQGDLHAK